MTARQGGWFLDPGVRRDDGCFWDDGWFLFMRSRDRVHQGGFGEDLSTVVSQYGRQPPLDGFDSHALALGVFFDLIPLDFAQAVITGFRVREVPAGNRCAGAHGVGFGQFNADALVGFDQAP